MTTTRGRTGSGMPLRGDRIHRYVNAFCPLCHEERARPAARRRPAALRLAGRARRPDLAGARLPDHGLVRTLYDESPEILSLPRGVDRADQGAHPRPAAATSCRCRRRTSTACREMQTQHTCILLEDLLDHCNLKCPTCFAESAPALSSVVPLAQVLASIDTRLSRENGRIDVLMLSGGEPTLYPQLAELLDEVAARPIVRVLVNTNGLTIAQDDELLALLTKHRERVEIYLQYDGESAAASTHHRGADIRRFKERAIERLSAAGIFTTLTMTAALGVNDDEIGFVVKRALDTPYVGGVTIQPRVRLRSLGRHRPARPAHAHRRPGPARRADRRPGHLARPDGAALLAPALLLGRLPAPRRLRVVAVAGRADRARAAQAVAGASSPTCSPTGSPTTRSPTSSRGGQGVPARPAQRAVVAVAPVDGLDLERHLPELRHRDRHPRHAGVVAAARSAPAAAEDARRARAARDRQAVHGHEHDDRGTAHPVLRARGHGGRRREPPVRAVLRGAGVAAAEPFPDLDGDGARCP